MDMELVHLMMCLFFRQLLLVFLEVWPGQVHVSGSGWSRTMMVYLPMVCRCYPSQY